MFKKISYEKHASIFLSVALEIKTRSSVLCSSFTALESHLLGTALLNNNYSHTLKSQPDGDHESHIKRCQSTANKKRFRKAKLVCVYDSRPILCGIIHFIVEQYKRTQIKAPNKFKL